MGRRKSNRSLASSLLEPLLWQKVFFFCLPFQLGKFIWFPFSFLFGLRVDYLAGKLYLLDLIGLMWALCFLITPPGRFRAWKRLNSFSGWWGMIVLIFVGLIGARGGRPGLFWLNWLEVGWFFGWYLVISAQEIDWGRGAFFLKISLCLVCLLAMAQFGLGRSIQGPFWWLGERRLSVFEPGIARFNLGDHWWLRPYATFSHPNNLAGFLIISLVWLGLIGELGRYWWWLVMITIFLSNSRPVWLLGCWWSGLNLLKKKKWFKWGIGCLGLFFFLLPKGLSIERRVLLNQCGGELLLGRLDSGIGWGHFLVEMMNCSLLQSNWRFIQPIHNVFLQILVESGIWLGLGIFVWLVNEYRNWGREGKIVFWFIFFLGLWDHYLLTAVQLRYLVLVVWGWAFHLTERDRIIPDENQLTARSW